MSRDATDRTKLAPGDPHYTAYVGPPLEYDFMGATQFRLLCSLGLRAGHRVLDFGCGSLRAGRFLLMYLDPGNYYGVEPNRWLIEDAIKYELGRELIELKRPVFDHNNQFLVDHLGTSFDYIVAQSIFSHSGTTSTTKCLQQFAAVIKPSGRILVTFIEGQSDPRPSDDWVYPHCCTYRPETISRLIKGAGLSGLRLPWYHPRQTWYLLARDKAALPTPEMLPHLSGAVLFSREFQESWKPATAAVHRPSRLRGPIGKLNSLLRGGRKSA